MRPSIAVGLFVLSELLPSAMGTCFTICDCCYNTHPKEIASTAITTTSTGKVSTSLMTARNTINWTYGPICGCPCLLSP
ncbi:unnamed protein product [Zymoseptoria tritici ST99CH_3D7]|uniref:Secreted protein n=2 Tax=Zymoseptoria tritici TaxID=1047171 RepID=A0A1X7RT44_ZYMT9|nr:unnamed protein product [Zymoseptoria tritici ST99CH_3D7]SMR52399.1 unnamed protein product [Zymoseptoria tritici ST99CH_1E4]